MEIGMPGSMPPVRAVIRPEPEGTETVGPTRRASGRGWFGPELEGMETLAATRSLFCSTFVLING